MKITVHQIKSLPCLDCIMFITYISIYNEYRYIQNINKNYTKYRIDKNCISMTPLFGTIDNNFRSEILLYTASSSSVNHSSLPFFASGGLDFRFWDYFQLIAKCIAHACAWHSDIMSSINIIWPKSQWGVVDTQAADRRILLWKQHFFILLAIVVPERFVDIYILPY